MSPYTMPSAAIINANAAGFFWGEVERMRMRVSSRDQAGWQELAASEPWPLLVAGSQLGDPLAVPVARNRHLPRPAAHRTILDVGLAAPASLIDVELD